MSDVAGSQPRIAAVIVGRNEASKLRRCVSSVLGHTRPVVFADSASTDGSADLARAMGVAVVELDGSAPVTAARGRNAGFAEALRLDPNIEYVQFVDADSEMIESWFERARDALARRPDCAVVFGEHRERFPEQSLYTRLYRIMEDARAGDPFVFRGIALIRVDAFRQVGGFHAPMLNLEDRELCLRLYQAGWRVLRLDVEMTIHEAGMDRFSQWWNRQMRGGHARAHHVALHGWLPPRHAAPEARSMWCWGMREYLSVWCWGMALPAVMILAAWPTAGVSLLLGIAYPVQFYGIYRRMRGRGFTSGDAALYAAACVLAKFPQSLGQIRFHVERLGHTSSRT